MNKKEIAQQFTKQTLEPTPDLLSSEQITGLINEIKIMHDETQLNLQNFQIKQRVLERSYDDQHNRLKVLCKPLEQLEERLTLLPQKHSVHARRAFWDRYWTVIAVGITSALLTSLIMLIT